MWALFFLACTGGQPAEKAPVRPSTLVPAKHALFILLDTTRADALAAADTPTIDELAGRGARAERSWSAGTWTVPSVISIFTGASIREHGWDAPAARMGRYPALPSLPTLAEVLQKAGFATTGFYSNPYLAESLGFDRGFDSWRRSADKAMPKQFAQEVEKNWGDGQRHFTYLHLLGPHSPLKPSPEVRAKHDLDSQWFEPRMGFEIGVPKRNRKAGARPAYKAAYHAVLEDTDALVGQILAALGEHKKDTLVVLTSDHGELLGEHGVVGHGTHVWEPLTHVPLVFAHPQPDANQLLPAQIGGSALADLVTFSLGVEHSWPETFRKPLPLISQREGQFALSTNGSHKGIWTPKIESFFALDTDPGETQILTDTMGLTESRSRWEASTPKAEPLELVAELPKETQEQLGALGYVE